MSSLSIALILLSSFFHAFWNIVTQKSAESQFFSGLKGIWIMAFGVLFLSFNSALSFPREIIFWSVISGVLHGVYILSLSKAYNTQDISYVYPIARSAPVFVPPFAWLLLGEKLTGASFFAIVLILLAIYTLHFKGHLVRGFRDLFDAIIHKDLRWAFVTLALVVSYSLVDKRGMDAFLTAYPDQPVLNGFLFFFMESLVGFSLCLAFIFIRNPREIVFSAWKKEWKTGLLAGAATVGSYGLICVVLQFESVSAVVALRQISVMFVVVWGCWKLKEPFGKQRLIASVLIVIGVFLIGR